MKPTVFLTAELGKIITLLSVGRKYGIYIAALPDVIEAISQSGYPNARNIAANLCPVSKDPWENQLGANDV